MASRAVVGVLVLTIVAAHCAAEQCGKQANFALCGDGNCCSEWGWCGLGDSYCGSGCQSGPCSGSTGAGSLGDILTKAVFENNFPNRNRFYTYESLINAAKSFSSAGFGTTGDTNTRKKEIAAFLAHIDHETGGLVFIEEQKPPNNYCDTENQNPYRCAPGKSYHGRGPMQLSWNYNYGACGAAINEGILAQPERVIQDATIAFKTAIWFWSTQQWNKPSCHAVMTGSWSPSSADNAANRRPGFGVTINIINGGLECNKNSAEADRRVQYYQKFCSLFGVDPGQNLDCRSQKPFG
ncbi:basic endochitinase B [Marchantia polymorpha subsp. ruderalis]|uniref:Chitin-binding type-1 domain-containing protein n=2 Tax=Marchantia polymorpha TaxID=3197 RepID=A0A176WR48_MARPO|nr:hypothetical protein AXG93_2841s1240 [Marchantia polymorpha subsp. ruderalis]PTQ35761.1 hypothetical protein MARPO_0069s0092 [Marchantia polymorpha]BBN03556.1 hypothetical protein Mp_2g24440 [Marchantia polymorpha subsp. ruderalis]|eukprot:PTQ35761.1 hypothetical protein MARPO_0069s0092 [Marchantia polymorpha]